MLLSGPHHPAAALLLQMAIDFVVVRARVEDMDEPRGRRRRADLVDHTAPDFRFASAFLFRG
jgi:hypothetical protein